MPLRALLRLLPRYFLRLFLPVFGLCLLIFAGVLLMNHFLKLFNLAVMKGISPLWIIACFTRLLPYVASLAIPMAFLVAMLLTLGQISETGEGLALRASGFSFGEITWPFLGVGMLLTALLLYLNHKASPDGFHAFRERQAEAVQQIARVDLEARSFLKLGPWKLFAREADPDSGRLEGVYVVRLDPGQRTIRVSAARGRLSIERAKGVSLLLEDGELQLPNPDPSKYTTGRFARYTVEVPLSGGPRPQRALDIPELSSPRLLERIRARQTSDQHRVEYKVELSLRSAIAFSPFIFFWIAAPLGLQLGRHSRARGFALSLAILFCFYGLVGIGIGLGRRSEALAYGAPWIANIAALGAGLLLTRRAAVR